jgi:hypothetical protein
VCEYPYLPGPASFGPFILFCIHVVNVCYIIGGCCGGTVLRVPGVDSGCGCGFWLLANGARSGGMFDGGAGLLRWSIWLCCTRSTYLSRRRRNPGGLSLGSYIHTACQGRRQFFVYFRSRFQSSFDERRSSTLKYGFACGWTAGYRAFMVCTV